MGFMQRQAGTGTISDTKMYLAAVTSVSGTGTAALVTITSPQSGQSLTIPNFKPATPQVGDTVVVAGDGTGSSDRVVGVPRASTTYFNSGGTTTFGYSCVSPPDASGNVLLCLVPLASGGTVVYNGVTYTVNAAGYGALLMQLSSTGTVKWTAVIKTTTQVYSSGSASTNIAVDPSGNYYLWFPSNAAATLYNSGGTLYGAANAGASGFLVSYTNAGFVRWSSAATGLGQGLSMTCDGVNLYVAGDATSQTTGFTIGALSATKYGTTASGGLALAQINATTGVAVWAGCAGGGTSLVASYSGSVHLDGVGNLYVMLEGSTTSFIWNGHTLAVTTSGIVWLKLSTTGAYVASLVTNTADSEYDVAWDSSGNCVAFGYGTLYFISAAGVHTGSIAISPMPSAGLYNAYYLPNGNLVLVAFGSLPQVTVKCYTTAGVLVWTATATAGTYGTGTFGWATVDPIVGTLYVTWTQATTVSVPVYSPSGPTLAAYQIGRASCRERV